LSSELQKLLRGADLRHRALLNLLLQPSEEGAQSGAVADVAGNESLQLGRVLKEGPHYDFEQIFIIVILFGVIRNQKSLRDFVSYP
jgi:hypothetical protein